MKYQFENTFHDGVGFHLTKIEAGLLLAALRVKQNAVAEQVANVLRRTVGSPATK